MPRTVGHSFEVLVFKISGTGAYADGDEANRFFSSIDIKRKEIKGWTEFKPKQGGFKVSFP